MTLPDIEITELQNALGVVPPGNDEIQIVIGCSSKGPLQTLATYGSIPDLVADFGHGPLVESAARSLLDSNGTPVVVCRAPNSTAGACGATVTSGVTGTAVVSASGAAYDDFEGYALIGTGGTLGADGVKFKWSLDGARTLSADTSLGVAYTFAIPDSGVTLAFEPPTGALVAAATEARADMLAHLANATAHDGADTSAAQVALAASSVPTTNAEAWAVLNLVRAAYVAHIAIGAPVHNSADSTNVLAAPVATSGQTGITLFADIKAKQTAHCANGTAHNSADATNVITAATPSRGTLAAGDVVTFATTAPKWAVDDITNAGTAIVDGQADFGFIQIAGPVSATEAAAIGTALDSLRATKRFKWAIFGARLPDVATSETETAWMASVIADYAGYFRNDVAICAGGAWVTSAISGRQYMRPITASVAARAVKVPIYVDLARVRDAALPAVALYNSTKNRIAHDESKRLGLTAAGFITLRTFPTLGLAAYITDPKLHSTPGSDFDLVQKRRCMNVLERVVYSVGLTIDLNAEGTTDPDTGYVSETSARDIEEEMRESIRESPLKPAISNPDDPALFVLSRTDPVLTNGGEMSAESRIQPLFYIKKLGITTGFKAGSVGA